uniref:Uncharacterized protein n=1 Tax=viral metagenome TaxID=1070528 RepID=A0A6M3J7C7_9ZZZZ
MAIQVDPTVSPRIITVPEADGVSISIQSLVNQIRTWEDNQVNLCYPRLLAASGKEVLDATSKVGITASLENTKLKFAARASLTTCSVSGGNLVAVDINGDSMFPIEPSTNVTVQLAQSSSPTLLDATDIRTDLAFIKQIEQGRWKIVSNQMIFYDTDGTTAIRTFDLKDKAGNATDISIFERVPV